MSREFKSLRVIVFFGRNPHEELLAADIDLKWGIPKAQVSNYLRNSVRYGLLSQAKTAQGLLVYSAGPVLRAWAAEAA